VELLILVVYLRALLAPLALLISSALGVAAALGLTVLVFQDLLGDPGLTFYAPFATAVLLLALGSDYNVFAVGSIWEAAGRMSLSRAIAVAMPSTARAIGAAGVILATTFAMVAIIPLQTFRQVAFTMAVGLLIDTFLIRPVVTPAVLTLLGPAASWPSRRVRTEDVSAEELRGTAVAAARDPIGSGARDARPPAEAGRR
jgi:RND superfamily putative drug exporter